MRRSPIGQSRTGPCGRKHHGGRFLNIYGTMAARINSGMLHARSAGKILMLEMMIDGGPASASAPVGFGVIYHRDMSLREPNDRASKQVPRYLGDCSSSRSMVGLHGPVCNLFLTTLA